MHIRSQCLRAVAFAVVLISISYILNILKDLKPISMVGSFLWSAMAIVWGQRNHNRITTLRIRRSLAVITASLILLFFTRMCRYKFFEGNAAAERYSWYLYYLPFIIVPLMSYQAAVCVGEDENKPFPKHVRALHYAATAMIILALTNDLHEQMLRFDENGVLHHRPLYFVIVIWSVLLSLAAFRELLLRSMLLMSKKLWFIPVIFTSFGVMMLTWYYINGGSPVLFGHKLFYMQDGYSLTFMGLWEGCMIIGLLPANTDYNKLFALSHTNAQLKNRSGEVKYSSHGAQTEGRELILRSKEISGGSVVWTEDVTAINRLNRDLEQANELLDEENDLIEEENSAAEERTRYETRNRLYDAIALHTHAQLNAIDSTLCSIEDLERSPETDLLLGTYVKRCANLMLIADGHSKLSSEELALSVSESLESLSLFGIDCLLDRGVTSMLPAKQLIAAYDLFEAAAEAVCKSCNAFTVTLGRGAVIRIETDTLISAEMLENAVHGTGLQVHAAFVDGTTVITAGGDSDG